MSTVTHDEKFKAVLRQVTIDNSKKEFIEIWDNQHMVKNYNLSALDIHGNVYTDSKTALRPNFLNMYLYINCTYAFCR